MTDRDVTSAFVWPQDWGTRGESTPAGDWNAAGDFASVFEAVGLTDFVVKGVHLNVSRSNSNPELGVTAGKVVVTQPSAQVKIPGDTVTAQTRGHGAAFIIEIEGESAIGLVDNDINYVYLDVDSGQDNTATIRTDTQDPPANLTGDPYLHIGIADTNTDSGYHANRTADVDLGVATTMAHKTKTNIPEGDRVHVQSDEHMQVTMPQGVEYTVDGELEIDGSFVYTTL